MPVAMAMSSLAKLRAKSGTWSKTKKVKVFFEAFEFWIFWSGVPRISGVDLKEVSISSDMCGTTWAWTREGGDTYWQDPWVSQRRSLLPQSSSDKYRKNRRLPNVLMVDIWPSKDSGVSDGMTFKVFLKKGAGSSSGHIYAKPSQENSTNYRL